MIGEACVGPFICMQKISSEGGFKMQSDISDISDINDLKYFIIKKDLNFKGEIINGKKENRFSTKYDVDNGSYVRLR